LRKPIEGCEAADKTVASATSACATRPHPLKAASGCPTTTCSVRIPSLRPDGGGDYVPARLTPSPMASYLHGMDAELTLAANGRRALSAISAACFPGGFDALNALLEGYRAQYLKAPSRCPDRRGLAVLRDFNGHDRCSGPGGDQRIERACFRHDGCVRRFSLGRLGTARPFLALSDLEQTFRAIACSIADPDVQLRAQSACSRSPPAASPCCHGNRVPPAPTRRTSPGSWLTDLSTGFRRSHAA